jgi:hypothetical protein
MASKGRLRWRSRSRRGAGRYGRRRPDHADGGAGGGDAAGRGRDTLRVADAITLRVADAITASVTSGTELAARLAVAADPLVRVLDHLVTAGFLRRDEDGAYALTDAGQWLRDNHPQGIRAWIDLEGAVGHADMSVVELLHTVRTGEPAVPRRFGRGFWEDLAEHPDGAASFDALMGRQLTAEALSFAATYDWSALGEVVDVEAATGRC